MVIVVFLLKKIFLIFFLGANWPNVFDDNEFFPPLF
jgi:hypothetical protein